MTSNIIEIEIVNFKKFNHRRDGLSSSWFRFENNFENDPDFYEKSNDFKMLWVFLLGMASNANGQRFKVSLLQKAHSLGLEIKVVARMIDIMGDMGLLVSFKADSWTEDVPLQTDRQTDIYCRETLDIASENNSGESEEKVAKIKKPEKKETAKQSHKRIVSHLNQETNSRYRASTKQTIRLLNKLLSEYSENEIKSVITYKSNEWLHKKEMQTYLRPETLFGSKFEGYLQSSARPDADDMVLQLVRDAGIIL